MSGQESAVREGVIRTVLVRDSGYDFRAHYYLFDVTRETPKLVYGFTRRRGRTSGQERKSSIAKDPATPLDLERITSAQAECERRTRAAREWERALIAEILIPSNSETNERTP